MRSSLLYNPRVLVERLALASQRARRRRRLRGTPAAALQSGHLDSLELLEALRDTPPMVIHDVGANVGTWTCLAKSLYPHAFVEAFEPLHEHEAGFARWTAAWPDTVRLHSIALGAAPATGEMKVTDFSDASSLLLLSPVGAREFNLRETRREPVRVETLDRLLAAGAIRAPDLIKLDVQGYELEVIKGASACLAAARWVLCEVSFHRYYEQQCLFEEVAVVLRQHGFTLHALGTGITPGAPLGQTDALFIRS